MMKLDVTCVICHETHVLEINENDFLDWQNGKHAQDAFPYLSANEREMLISGICSPCWDALFGGEN